MSERGDIYCLLKIPLNETEDGSIIGSQAGNAHEGTVEENAPA